MTTSRGGMGVGGGMEFQEAGDVHVPVAEFLWQKPAQYFKAVILQLKIN